MKCLVLALASLMALHASAGTATWKGSGDIEFAGTSTLHAWAGKVKTEPFSAIVVSSDAGQPQQLNATVQVKVLGMDTAEPDRNKNMRKSMNAAVFPLITATMETPFSKLMDPSSKQPATLPFTLELLGQKHPVTGRISHWKATDRDAAFDLDFELSLKDCGITVPTVLLFIRVGDTIKLHASVKLQRSND